MAKKSNEETQLKDSFLERVARMYYVLGLSQQEISEQLDFGRSSIARFLNEARERGIIQFKIRSDLDNNRCSAIENQLLTKFGLKDCVVFRKDNAVNSFEFLTSQYLDSVLPSNGAIGLGWGKTVFNVGVQMHLCDARPALKIVQLSGGSGAKEDLVPAASVIQTWAQALRAKAVFFPAPAVASTVESKANFLSDPNIQDIFKELSNVNVAVVGIGSTGEDATIISSNLVPGLDSSELSKTSVGDVIFHFYNSQGQFSNPGLSQRVVGASPADFMAIELRIGIAYGSEKTNAIAGALQGKLVNVLITTEETAMSLL
ncbi:sugar-binding transcriptional regulator [Paenibacillus piri]|uniref:Sugar-binding domain-containing protein n=1 Tax=Paenibacillus piri TaxID=2547395 RepID=A0A4R5KQF9_9BACL|nr:sugar-binding domain-containing protein [Paenibacillus piri]TDF97961.1 hypothetical protein E1757_10595 [Paenibacillus piri]